MLASPSTSVKATSLKEYVPLVGSVCDLFAMMVVNILLLELGPIPPLFIKNNYFIFVTKECNIFNIQFHTNTQSPHVHT